MPQAPTSPEKVTLGRALFFEKRLSRSQDISCNSCHGLDKFGTDGRATSIGSGGQLGSRNAPTVFNAGTHIAQFWDGRAPNVEHQATGPIMNPKEMGMPSEQAVVAVLRVHPGVRGHVHQGVSRRVRKPVTLKNVGDAIGGFVRGLVTVSRWDKFIAGDNRRPQRTGEARLARVPGRRLRRCHRGQPG